MVAEAFSPADTVFHQLAAVIIGKISYLWSSTAIPEVSSLNGTHQGVVVVFMAGCQFLLLSLPVTDGGYEVEPGMIGIGADHAVGVGEMVEEADG